MDRAKRLLFVCSLNQRRSMTAAWLFRNLEGYEVRSAGTEPGARQAVTGELVSWADWIFVMEQMHVRKLRRGFKSELAGKRLICLQIPDKHGGMSLELIKLLKQRLGLYLQMPK